MFMAESNVGYKRCEAGDLVINTMWAWMGAAGIAWRPGIVSPAYGVYRLDLDRLDPQYVDLLVRSKRFVGEMGRFSDGVWSSRLRLYPETFLSMTTHVPDIDEQRRIVASVKSRRLSGISLKAKLSAARSLLQERRQALITAAVTGQLKIPAA
jgi:type I restriction enzyme S subunit